MESILVISELTNYFESYKFHFSLTKGMYVAEGFSKYMQCYYVTTGKSVKYNDVNIVNIDEIDDDFLKHIGIILFIREGNLMQIMDSNTSIKNLLLKKEKTHLIGIKSDTLSYLYGSGYSFYKKEFPKKYGIKFIDFINNKFDILCCQTIEYMNDGLTKIRKIYPEYYNSIKSKIFISRMGVPNKSPLDFNIENPYDINHGYCCNHFDLLTNEKALHPLCYTDVCYKFTQPKNRAMYNIPKIKLIFMGRCKTDGGKILFLMRDIMKKLGEEYELHLFPGRFMLPECDISVLSPKWKCNLQVLRDSIFYGCKNVIIHYPFDDINKTKYVQYADIGIDFSQKRPNNFKSPQGNCKLLEYCYYGLKVVAEKNINNSDIVVDCNNGILLNGVATVDDFVNAIKKIAKSEINREYAINTTIKNNNWDLIAKEIYDRFMQT